MEPVGLQSASPMYLVAHHTDIPCSEHAEQADIIDGAHKRKGYPASVTTGDYIAYHYLVGCDGTVKETRPPNEPSIHTGCGMGEDRCKAGFSEVNEHSIAIAIAGNMQVDQPSQIQIDHFNALIEKLRKEYNIEPGNIVPHSAVSATSCAGKNMNNIIYALNQY